MTELNKESILNDLVGLIEKNRDEILVANRADLAACPSDDAVIIDRLEVDNAKIDAMIRSVKSVAAQADPQNDLISTHTREDGLRIENRKVPFGTVLIIYEARPDVTIEAAAIAMKGGNRILLKGGKEAKNTNVFLTSLWHQALNANGASTERVRYLDISRDETRDLIAGKGEKFDLVIPRGGDALIDFVLANSKVPVIVSGRGNNFLYIDSEADVEMAVKIALDGKSRLSVCNALDKILIDRTASGLVKDLVAGFNSISVDVFGDAEACNIAPDIIPIGGEDVWDEEFLSAKIVIGIVYGLDEAIAKSNRHSGGHSATIVTSNEAKAAEFMNRVDCAAVYHNASTRFTDGGELGLGAEIAISTQKLHFRGPLGAEHLMTNKWFVYGDGHVRK